MDIVGMIVGVVVLLNLAELNSRGWPIYRGSAAQFFVGLCVSLEMSS